MQSYTLILKYFTDLTEEQKIKFSKLAELYTHWNEQINVISRKDIDNFYEHHVLHSLAIARIMPFLPKARVLDIGTGGGFPGIPLAILYPETQFVLADSIAKKIKVVQAVAHSLDLKNIEAIHTRAETLSQKFDFIVSRAVAPLPELVKWSQKKCHTTHRHSLPNGILCLKGGDQLLEEIAHVSDKRHVKTWQIKDLFDEPFFETKKVVYVKM